MSGKPPEPRRHHYVPKFLLKGFATPGKRNVFRTQVFDKHTGRTYVSPIKDVMLEGDFNALQIDAENRVSLEEHIGRFEDIAAPLLERVVAARSIAVLSEVDRLEVARFVALQFIRGTGHRAVADQMAKDLLKEIKARAPSPTFDPGFDLEPEQVKAFGLLAILGSLDDFASHMAAKEMVLVQAPAGSSFILGDNPVTLTNDEPAGFLGNLGIASKGIQIHLPLTVELTLGLWCPSIGEQIMAGSKDVRTHIGNLKAKSVLGARGAPLTPAALAELDRMLEGLAPIDRVFTAGEPFAAKADNVIRLNSLQVAHAERFVVSPSGNFELVKKMLADDVAFKVGRRMRIN